MQRLNNKFKKIKKILEDSYEDTKNPCELFTERELIIMSIYLAKEILANSD